MTQVRANGSVASGYPIGMLCAQWNIPFVPGDLNNASTFEFPMRYLEVEGLIGADILRGNGEKYTPLMVDAAQQLEAEGVRALTSNCGFMAVFQDAVAEAVDIPVFLSSLLQLGMATSMVGAHHRVGVIAANSAAVTPELFARVGFKQSDRVVVQGLEGFEHFREVILDEVGVMDPDRFAEDVLDGARALIAGAPDVGAILLECSDLPPYAAAIGELTGLPVFDWASFIDHIHRALTPRTYPSAR